ncbi:monocarboxylate transporter 8-like [Montipora capricornis]|uniref:monocarboxylate transporter 8-like n=1 Tax=Montipora capricornis TaxID=246305 RepID=UPI0035F19171
MAHVRDGKWSWFVCFSAALSWFAAMGFVFSFGVFFPVFVKYFQETREKTAWVGSLAIALVFFAGHLSGALVRRFGCRFTTLLGGFLCTISLVLSSFAKNILHLYLTYSLLYGLGASFIFSSSLVIISMYFEKRRSLATGIITSGQGCGVLILGPLLQISIDAFGWRITYRIMSAVVPALCLFGLTYSPNVEIEEVDNIVTQRKKESCHVDVSVWKEPKFLAVTLSASIMMFGHLVPQIHLVRYCEDIGINADAASLLFVYYGVSSCVGRLASGRLLDFHRVNTFYVYQAAELVVGAGILLVTLATSYLHMVIFIIIYGLCDGVYITSLNVLVLKCVSPAKTSVALAWEMQLSSLFLASGPPIAGLIADYFHSYIPAFYMSGAVVLVGACFPFMLLCLKDEVRDRRRDLYLDADYNVNTAEIDGVQDWRNSVICMVEEKAN